MKKMIAKGITLFLVIMVFISNVSIHAAASPKLNKTNVTIYVGETFQLMVKGTSKTVKWSSNKKSVVTVSKGTIKGKSAGTAKITAKAGKKKFVCTVTVKQKKPVIRYAKPYQISEIGTVYDGKEFFTMMGKKYYYGFVGEPCYNSWAEYNLAGKYSTMQFSLGHIDNTAFEDATFNLFFDGNLEEQISLSANMTTITKQVDVRNVDVMRVEIRDAAHVTSYYGIANIVFDDSIKLLPADQSTANITKGKTVYAIPYQTGDVGEIYKGESFFEMMGKKYYYGFVGEPCYDSVAQINLEGKYTSFSYKIGHIDNSAYEDATLLIELDGEVVDTVKLSGNMTTQERSINVAGGVNLKIQIRDAAYVTSYYGIADMKLK